MTVLVVFGVLACSVARLAATRVSFAPIGIVERRARKCTVCGKPLKKARTLSVLWDAMVPGRGSRFNLHHSVSSSMKTVLHT
jgi:hypothetical protein